MLDARCAPRASTRKVGTVNSASRHSAPGARAGYRAAPPHHRARRGNMRYIASDSDAYDSDDYAAYNASQAGDLEESLEGDDLMDPNARAHGAHGVKYAVYEPGDYERVRREMIERATTILGTSSDEAAALLHHRRWNLEEAVTAWFEDETKARVASGLCAAGEQMDGQSDGTSTSGMCGICFEDFERSELFSTGCEHAFCADCWSGYVSSKLGDGNPVVNTTCPMTKCSVKVQESTLRRFLSDEDRQKFNNLLWRSFVELNERIQPCPGVDCERSIAFENLPRHPVCVQCTCGTAFCFSCGGEPHSPVCSCGLVKEWLQRVESDGANSEWLLVNTKACPKCSRPILKNGGCMHMLCSHCEHSFCWLCLGRWDNVQYKCATNCNSYRANGGLTTEENRRKRARESLERYVHYYERFTAHSLAGKKATDDVERFKASVLDTLMELQRRSASQVCFIMDALRQVAECRRILKWTYAYAFQELENDNRKRVFFEYIQGDMEHAIEFVSRMIEVDLKAFLPPDPEEGHDENETIENYHYPSEEQETFEKDFDTYRSLLMDRTALLRKSCDTLCAEMANGLLGSAR